MIIFRDNNNNGCNATASPTPSVKRNATAAASTDISGGTARFPQTHTPLIWRFKSRDALCRDLKNSRHPGRNFGCHSLSCQLHLVDLGGHFSDI